VYTWLDPEAKMEISDKIRIKGDRMSIALATNWWSLVVRGVAALLFGVLTIMWPGITLTALVFLFAAYALIDGIVNIAGMVKAIHRHDRWGVLLLEGIVGVAAAAVAVAWPAITAVALVYLIAAWAIVTGGFEVAAAVRLRKHVSGEWLLALSGIASLVFGILLMIAPLTGALVIALWIGAYALIFGALLVVLGFRLQRWGKAHTSGPSMAASAH
jgi:uncharacterized membrane protein HdeD (DUF308 family)